MDEYQALANAVVKRAVWDYEEALCKDHEYSTRETQARMRECEAFFNGAIIHLYTNLDGELLMEKARKHCEEHEYNLSKVRRDRNLYDTEEDECLA